MARQETEAHQAVIRSSGNVFADLGFADGEQRQTKVRLAFAVNRILQRRRLSQTEAAHQLGINQPKISALSNYRLAGFSVERLMHFLTALEQDVEIVIRRKPPSRRAARIVVSSAYGNRELRSDAPTRRPK
jgi:predicted XRE-type DNA-binding protein